VGEALQSMLAAVGIGLDVRGFEWATFYDDVRRGNFQLYSLSWIGVNDPDFFYGLLHSAMRPPLGNNRGGYANPEMDRLTEAGRETLDTAKRREIYAAVQRLAAEDLPFVLSFWEYVAFLANSLIFILIGMNTANQPLRELGSIAALTAVCFVLLSRIASVYPLALLFRWSKRRLPMPYQHVLFWGGLRGALALALALAVPPSIPERSAIIIAAFVVVAFSILVQGLTMPFLLRHYELTEQS